MKKFTSKILILVPSAFAAAGIVAPAVNATGFSAPPRSTNQARATYASITTRKRVTVKKIIAATVLAGAALAGSLGVASPASASSTTFVAVLGSNGWHEGSPGYLLNLGYDTCRTLNSGYSGSWNAAVNHVYYSTDRGTSWSQANWFVSQADTYLC